MYFISTTNGLTWSLIHSDASLQRWCGGVVIREDLSILGFLKEFCRNQWFVWRMSAFKWDLGINVVLDYVGKHLYKENKGNIHTGEFYSYIACGERLGVARDSGDFIGLPRTNTSFTCQEETVVRWRDGIRRHFSGGSVGGKQEPLLDISLLGLITSQLTALCFGNWMFW